MSENDVLITGIGIMSCLGEGIDAHFAPDLSTSTPILDTSSFFPYTVHPLSGDIDWGLHIPRKEQRQMEQWQRIGTYTAGLALQDAGVKNNDAFTSRMDMIVAAGGGERDTDVDTQILRAAHDRSDLELLLNEKLTTELRPTLFLAQLSNLLAGNISIVHKVTGSSRTFMGEEGAGIAAVQTALSRIASGQSTHILVGGAFNAQHPDTLLSYELGGFLKKNGWSPLWQRNERGGVITGSGAAFIVLEQRKSAIERGAPIYAHLEQVVSAQSNRQPYDLTNTIEHLLNRTMDSQTDLLISGASGASGAMEAEKSALSQHPDVPIRGFTGLTGHMKETQFPFTLALAAASIKRNEAFAATDHSFEKLATSPIERAVTLTVGYHRSEGAAFLKRG
jgi:3-oxoacyl-[acyl-carrier-protein] synthase II